MDKQTDLGVYNLVIVYTINLIVSEGLTQVLYFGEVPRIIW